MKWNPCYVQRPLFGRPGKLTLICLGAMFIALIFPSRLSAQAQVFQTHPYWGVGAYISDEYLPPIELTITRLGDNVRVAWPLGGTNRFLMTATSLSPDAEWLPIIEPSSTDSGERSVTLSATNSEQYFRLIGSTTSLMPIFGFAIFFNGQLEFTYSAPLTVRGRTHANGPICLGAAQNNILRFTETVTTASSIVYSNLGGYAQFAAPIYEGTPTNIIGTPVLQLPIGTNNTAAAMREIINLPPLGESPSSPLGQERYYNKAAIVLLVSNTTVNLIVKNPGTSSGTLNTYFYTNTTPSTANQSNLNRFLPWVSLTNRFYDYRESKWVMPTQIDMGKLKTWVVTNSLTFYKFPRVMYVADFRTLTNLHVVRLTNGTVIPTNAPTVGAQPAGFTLVTINPLYVWGHYNCPNPAHLGTTNTTQTYPASLVADALTVLSPNWQDSTYGNAGSATYGTGGLDNRDAVSVTINAAIIAGTVYSTGSAVGQWSGGAHNLPRLLEDWAGTALTLNTSMVNLYDSVRANTQFQNPGVYYRAPTRNINFDQNFNNPAKLPPGTPVLVDVAPAN